MRFKSCLYLCNLFVIIRDVLILNVSFYVPYTIVYVCSFLVLHFLWTPFRSLSYPSLLDPVGLSIHFLYAAFFSSNAILHSSSKHHLLSGLGWYPIVCSASSTATVLSLSILPLYKSPLLLLVLFPTFQILFPITVVTT